MTSCENVLTLYADNGLRPWLEECVAPHLSRWEVICRCGICFRCTLSPRLRALWSEVREGWGRPLAINSGLRCPDRQREINPKVTDSLHLVGEAIDIAWPKEVSREDFLRFLEEKVGEGGVGVYRWGVHIDTGWGRTPNRRWGEVTSATVP